MWRCNLLNSSPTWTHTTAIVINKLISIRKEIYPTAFTFCLFVYFCTRVFLTHRICSLLAYSILESFSSFISYNNSRFITKCTRKAQWQASLLLVMRMKSNRTSLSFPPFSSHHHLRTKLALSNVYELFSCACMHADESSLYCCLVLMEIYK